MKRRYIFELMIERAVSVTEILQTESFIQIRRKMIKEYDFFAEKEGF